MHPRVLGALFVFSTCVLWISASFLAQSLVKPGDHAHSQLPPVLLVYISTSLFSLWLPLVAAKHELLHGSSSSRSPLLLCQQSASLPRNVLASICKVLPIASIWFAAQLTFTFSLANTSVTSNTILSSSSSMFTLLASAAVLRERITASKLLSVLAVMAGTAAVTLSDAAAADVGSTSLLGDGLCLASALCYSIYTVGMQKQLRTDDTDAPAVFFGYVGCLTLAAGLPVMLALQLLGEFDLRTLHPRALGLAVVNGLMDYVAADYTWARAVLLLGSTGATLGMSAQIPMATVGDLLLRRHSHWLDSHRSIAMTCLGTALILAGVVGINLSARPAGTPTAAPHQGTLPQEDNTAPLLEHEAV